MPMPSDGARPGMEPLRVVLVDDEASARLTARAVLDRAGGFTVVAEAHDGPSCVAAVQAHGPDIVLLDLLLASLDGAALVGPILRACPTAMVSVFSGLPAVRHRERLRSLGAFSYYEKTEITALPLLLRADHDAFLRALSGEDVVAPAVCQP